MIDEREPVERHPGNDKVAAAASTPRLLEVPTQVEELCNLLADRVEAHRGARPKITAQWSKDMDLLLRRGPTEWADPVAIPPPFAAKMINGIFDVLSERDAKGFCWADQVRSPAALRRHWDACRLAGTAVRRAPKARRRPSATGDERSLPELLDAARRAEERDNRQEQRSRAR